MSYDALVPPKPKPNLKQSTNSNSSSQDITLQLWWLLSYLQASNSGLLADIQWPNHFPPMIPQTMNCTPRLIMPSRNINALVGDTSSVDASLSHGNKPLPATTTNDNPETPTALHCGWERLLTKCGNSSKHYGYARMVKRLQWTKENCTSN